MKSLLENWKMVSIENIHSLTDFRHNAKKYVEQLQTTKSPLVLTVNGEAAIVVEDAQAFQATQDRLRQLEAEIEALKKLEALRAAVAVGAEQAERGQFSRRSFDEIVAAAHTAVTDAESP